MDIWGLVGGTLGGLVGGSALCKLILDATKDRWMEKVKAAYAEDLERLKDELKGKQAELQAQIDRGSYVTKAQYDLELSSYKELWLALSELRERFKSYFIFLNANGPGLTTEQKEADLAEAGKKLVAAYNAAVLVVGSCAPFYEKAIQLAAWSVTLRSQNFSNTFIGLIQENTAESIGKLNMDLAAIYDEIETIDGMIRNRLSSLRLVT